MKNRFFTAYIHHLILFISAFIFSIKTDKSMPDDGLRHIAFSYNKDIMKSWGDVFPNSLFGDYDPWFMWHNLLGFFSNFVSYEYIHILINTLSLYFLMVLIAKHIKNEIKYDFSSLLYIVVFSIAFLTSFRYMMVRPDLLSGLYILCALLLSKKFLPIFILTIVYSPFYYLFFMYTGSVGLVYLIQKKWQAFWGAFTASFLSLMIFLVYDFDGYVSTVKNILIDQKLRMGLQVGEGKPMFDFLSHLNYFVLLGIFFLITLIVIYKKYNYFKNKTIPLFLLITAILWLNQNRYYSLFLPLIIIYILSIVLNSNKKTVFFLFRKYSLYLIKNINYSKKVFIFYIIAIPYSIYIFSIAYTSYSLNENIEESQIYKNKIFDNKILLINTLKGDVYRGLYYNPTMHFVPSCSIGWFDDKDKNIKDIYIRMQKENGINEEELYKLTKYVNADFYIHYLTVSPKQVLNFKKLETFGITPNAIYNNRIIFNVKKEINK